MKGDTLDNIIVIQTDEVVQEEWDTARRLSCATAAPVVKQKKVLFKPFMVDMLEVVTVPTASGTSIDCWMDIRKGQYPNVRVPQAGEKITKLMDILLFNVYRLLS
jgi:hypothetical protein